MNGLRGSSPLRAWQRRIGAAVLTWALAASAQAHIASSGFLVANVAGSDVTGSIEVAVRDVELAVGVDANRDNKITWRELRDGEPQLALFGRPPSVRGAT